MKANRMVRGFCSSRRAGACTGRKRWTYAFHEAFAGDGAIHTHALSLGSRHTPDRACATGKEGGRGALTFPHGCGYLTIQALWIPGNVLTPSPTRCHVRWDERQGMEVRKPHHSEEDGALFFLRRKTFSLLGGSGDEGESVLFRFSGS